MRRTDLTADLKRPTTCSPSRSSACENLSRSSWFDGNSRYFEARAPHQFGNGDKCARRVMVVKVAAIDRVEFVVQIEIRAINGYRHEIRHRQSGSFQ